MEERRRVEVERLELDFSNVPVKPVGKKEIQQLETALIIGTLYRPEVVELIKDPYERATWIDSLAVAAAALAREKAGYPASRIADEIGRSVTMIRAHLAGKTKAGRLVRETYEKLVRGELKLTVPYTGIQLTLDEYEKLRSAEKRAAELEERVRSLEERLRELAGENEQLREKLGRLEAELKAKESRVEELEKRLGEYEGVLARIREILKCT